MHRMQITVAYNIKLSYWADPPPKAIKDSY